MKNFRYHLHIYFMEHQTEHARALHQRVRENWMSKDVAIGRFVPGLRGPHLHSQFEVDAPESAVDSLIAWFRKNREGLSVLVHPELKDELRGHTQECIWIGMPLSLDYSRLDYTEKKQFFEPFGKRPELERLT